MPLSHHHPILLSAARSLSKSFKMIWTIRLAIMRSSTGWQVHSDFSYSRHLRWRFNLFMLWFAFHKSTATPKSSCDSHGSNQMLRYLTSPRPSIAQEYADNSLGSKRPFVNDALDLKSFLKCGSMSGIISRNTPSHFAAKANACLALCKSVVLKGLTGAIWFSSMNSTNILPTGVSLPPPSFSFAYKSSKYL